MSNSTALQHIGQNIRDLRKYRGLTQQELAEKSGIRTATVSDIEKGLANFEINTIIRIATALNCALDISFTPLD